MHVCCATFVSRVLFEALLSQYQQPTIPQQLQAMVVAWWYTKKWKPKEADQMAYVMF